LSAHRILPPLRKATGDDDVDSVTIAALNTCLSLSHSDPGSEILLASDTIRQLAILCVESRQDPWVSRRRASDTRIYCSALHVTAMLAGSSLASHSDVGADLIRFCATLEQRMLDAMAPKQVTLAALREAEVTALFFSHLAKSFGGSWQAQDPEGQLRCRKACALFLRWLAAPQLVSGIKCPRQTAADDKLADENAKTRAKQAWFQATARGDAVREATSPLIGVVAKGSPVADAASRKTGNAYSEAIASGMYAAGRRAAEFLASFPRAVDAASLGFDVTAALRDQCDAVALDDFADAPRRRRRNRPRPNASRSSRRRRARPNPRSRRQGARRHHHDHRWGASFAHRRVNRFPVSLVKLSVKHNINNVQNKIHKNLR
jgi:nuclear pore complex protein Nup188